MVPRGETKDNIIGNTYFNPKTNEYVIVHECKDNTWVYLRIMHSSTVYFILKSKLEIEYEHVVPETSVREEYIPEIF